MSPMIGTSHHPRATPRFGCFQTEADIEPDLGVQPSRLDAVVRPKILYTGSKPDGVKWAVPYSEGMTACR